MNHALLLEESFVYQIVCNYYLVNNRHKKGKKEIKEYKIKTNKTVHNTFYSTYNKNNKLLLLKAFNTRVNKKIL